MYKQTLLQIASEFHIEIVLQIFCSCMVATKGWGNYGEERWDRETIKMPELYQWKQILFSVCVLLPAFNSQRILDQTDNRGYQCVGESLIFTCETVGSSVIIWRSDDYVGEGNQLEFASSFNSPGNREISRVYPETFAILTIDSNEDGTQMLASELHVTVRAGNTSPSISCVHANGSTATTTLRVLADPDMGELISYETEDSNGNCMVHVSWTLSSNNQIEDVELFMVFINGTNIKNETNINKTLATRVYPVCTCGTHAVNITAIDQCGNEGVSARHVTNNDLLLFEEGVCTDLNGGVDSGIRRTFVGTIIAGVVAVVVIVLE